MLDRGCEVGLVAGVACDAIATLDQAVATSRMPMLMASVGFVCGIRMVLPSGFSLSLNYSAYASRLVSGGYADDEKWDSILVL